MPQDFDGTLTLDQVGLAYSAPGGPFQLQTWPRYVYHATEAPRVVSNKEEFEALGEGWSLQYQHKDYPKMMFAPNGDTVAVNTPEEEAAQTTAEGGPWADAPHGSTDPMSTRSRTGNFTLRRYSSNAASPSALTANSRRSPRPPRRATRLTRSEFVR